MPLPVSVMVISAWFCHVLKPECQSGRPLGVNLTAGFVSKFQMTLLKANGIR